MRNEIALRFLAIESDQLDKLLATLDTFRDDAELERMRKRDYRTHDHLVLSESFDSIDE